MNATDADEELGEMESKDGVPTNQYRHQNAYLFKKYHTDDAFRSARQQATEQCRQKRLENVEYAQGFRKRVSAQRMDRYKNDAEYRATVCLHNRNSYLKKKAAKDAAAAVHLE